VKKLGKSQVLEERLARMEERLRTLSKRFDE
jgi:hypothetical protein